jgi:hypothetical protein
MKITNKSFEYVGNSDILKSQERIQFVCMKKLNAD